MPIDYGDENSDYVKLPKVGEADKTFQIKSCSKIVDPNYKYNFTKKEEVKDKDGNVVLDGQGNPVKAEVNQGFRYVFECHDGKSFTISSWKPYYAFKEVNVQDGDVITVSHPSEGVWKVTKGKLPESVKTEAWDE